MPVRAFAKHDPGDLGRSIAVAVLRLFMKADGDNMIGAIREAFEQADRAQAIVSWHRAADQACPRWPKLADLIDGLVLFAFPPLS